MAKESTKCRCGAKWGPWKPSPDSPRFCIRKCSNGHQDEKIVGPKGPKQS